MKREFFKPEMKISTFSVESVVTTSFTGASINQSVSVEEYNATDAQAVFKFSEFVF